MSKEPTQKPKEPIKTDVPSNGYWYKPKKKPKKKPTQPVIWAHNPQKTPPTYGSDHM